MLKRISVVSLAVIVLGVIASFALRSKAKNAGVTIAQDAGMTICNNTSDNRWVNVPIEISSLGDHNYRVTNKSGMEIKRFILAIYAAHPGIPLHGNGSMRHYVPVVSYKSVPVGGSVELNIEENLKEFSKMPTAADMSRVEIWPEIVDFADQDPAKRWRGGTYLRSTGPGTWEEDPDLNPKEHRDVVAASSTQGR